MQCAHCKNALDHNDSFCEHCGYPVKGTEEAKSDFYVHLNSKQQELQGSGGSLRRATNSLYVIAAAFAVYAIVYYYINPAAESAMEVLLTNLSLCIIFFLLGWWSTRKPVAALVSGITLYLALQLVNIVTDPTTIFHGIILKVFVLIYLFRGLQSALQAGRLNRELKRLR
jgi:hypothetical protein